MQINNRQRTLVILAALGLGLLLGDRLILTPLTSAWKGRSKQISQLKKTIEDGKNLLQREQPIRQRWLNMKSNTLPSNVSIAESKMMNAFDRWARESKVTVHSIRPQWKPTDEDYMTFDCQADATGSLDSLSRFLYEIEKDPLGIKFEGMEISSRDANGQQLSLTLQLSGLLLQQQEQ